MNQLLINTIGYNASGKTTVSKKLADSLSLHRVNGDDFRKFVYENVPYFESLDISYPTPKGTELTPLVLQYRYELCKILLRAGQSVIFEGSGFTPEQRLKIMKLAEAAPSVTTLILWIDIEESELIQRLNDRDSEQKTRWLNMYYDHKKALFEAPAESEADVLLRYDQDNYDEIEEQIKALLT